MPGDVRTAPIPTPIEAAAGARAVNYSSLAALVFLLYDIILTFDQEVELFWPRRWTFMKFDFFFVRYFPLFAQVPLLFVGSELSSQFHFSPHDCFIWQVYQGVISVLTILSCDYILLARIRAQYYHSKYIPLIVTFCYLLELVGMCVGLALALPGVRFDSICAVTDVPMALLVYAGASVLFQSLLFGLTLYKFIQNLRSGWGQVPIIRLLMRDGTWAFFVLFFYMAADSSLYGLKNHALAGILYGWILSSFSVCGYRILLNINHLSRRPHSPDTSGTISNSIRFTEHICDTDLSVSYEMSDMTSAYYLSSSTASGSGSGSRYAARSDH